jgi:hypothetical protein
MARAEILDIQASARNRKVLREKLCANWPHAKAAITHEVIALVQEFNDAKGYTGPKAGVHDGDGGVLHVTAARPGLEWKLETNPLSRQIIVAWADGNSAKPSQRTSGTVRLNDDEELVIESAGNGDAAHVESVGSFIFQTMKEFLAAVANA